MLRPTWEHRRESYAFRLRGFHPLWRDVPVPSAIHTICNSLNHQPLAQSRPTTPVAQRRLALPCRPVWAVPRSLAATRGITIVFFSCRYLDVSVSCVRLMYLCIQYMMTRIAAGRVFPFGHPRVKGCLHLSGAYRSLPRPSSPLSAKASTVCP